jgi:hypothetical protein
MASLLDGGRLLKRVANRLTPGRSGPAPAPSPAPEVPLQRAELSHVAICTQSHVAGWAMRDGHRAPVSVEVNNEEPALAEITVHPELAAEGFPADAGFLFRFAEPLTADDIVNVRFDDGRHISGSPTQMHAERLRLLTSKLRKGQGLEFGALDRPLLSKERYKVSYVDHESREGLQKKYGQVNDITFVDPARLVEVDYVWRDRLKDAVGGKRFSWAVACGVVEHIADPIDWLQQIGEVLVPGGLLVLEVPDGRLSFDRNRRLTTVAELLDDHRRQLKQPSFRQIYDHISRIAQLSAPQRSTEENRLLARQAFGVASGAVETGMYVDVHCHVWTQESWIECWQEIGWLDLLPFVSEDVSPPLAEMGGFVAFLRRPIDAAA